MNTHIPAIREAPVPPPCAEATPPPAPPAKAEPPTARMEQAPRDAPLSDQSHRLHETYRLWGLCGR